MKWFRRPGASSLRCQLNLDRLEEREVPASYTLTPVVPTIDAALATRLDVVVQRGLALGNRPNVFTRAGDSITFAPNFLVPLGTASATTDRSGDGSLTDTLGYFRSGQIGSNNSFTNPSTAAHGGWTAADVLAHLPGELAASRPAFVLVMVGTNDVALGVSVATYRQNLAAIVQTALDAGVVPVLSTIPDIPLYPQLQEAQTQYNQAIEDLGESLQVPVWNFWRALQRLPGGGIGTDGVHPSVAPGGGGDLTEGGLNYGYNTRNLTALQTLDKLRHVLLSGQAPDLSARYANWVPLTSAVPVAAGDTTGFQVQFVDLQARTVVSGFDPFAGFRGGVRVALGDVNRDGVPDLVAAVGSEGPPHVKVFDGATGALLASFYAFDAGYTGGLNIATGDINGDGAADIVVGAAVGAHVKVFTGSGQELNSFYAFDAGFQGGVEVAATDADGDARADVVVAAGTGGHGHIEVISAAKNQLLASYFAFGADFGGRLSIAAGDFAGTGQGQIAIGADGGAAPHVIVVRPLTGVRVSSFYAYASGFFGGISLGAFTHAGRTDLMTISDTAAVADVRRFDALGNLVGQGALYGVGYRRGAAFGG